MIKPAYSVSFLLSINIFVWQNVLYFLDAPRIMKSVFVTVEDRTREGGHYQTCEYFPTATSHMNVVSYGWRVLGMEFQENPWKAKR